MNEPDAPPVTTAMLHGFVDGQLDDADTARVLDWLATHADDALRVAEWHAQRMQLRQLHRAIDPGPTPGALTAIVTRRRRAWHRSPWAQAAAAVLLLAIGAGAGRYGSDLARGVPGLASHDGAPPFVRDAVVAHAVYAPERRHPVEVDAAEEAHLVQWLSRRLGAPLRAPALQSRGFRLLGGRLLPGSPAPRAQFMYEDTAGRRVTLYVTVFAPGTATGEVAFRSVRDGASESFYWIEGRFGYALSAELRTAELQSLAREVYAQLTR